jgi:hypothetical protein
MTLSSDGQTEPDTHGVDMRDVAEAPPCHVWSSATLDCTHRCGPHRDTARRSAAHQPPFFDCARRAAFSTSTSRPASGARTRSRCVSAIHTTPRPRACGTRHGGLAEHRDRQVTSCRLLEPRQIAVDHTCTVASGLSASADRVRTPCHACDDCDSTSIPPQSAPSRQHRRHRQQRDRVEADGLMFEVPNLVMSSGRGSTPALDLRLGDACGVVSRSRSRSSTGRLRGHRRPGARLMSPGSRSTAAGARRCSAGAGLDH